MSVIEEIASERQRQIEKEGWSPGHDDQHDNFELAMAAALYAAAPTELKEVRYCSHGHIEKILDPWPWWDYADMRACMPSQGSARKISLKNCRQVGAVD